MVPAAPWPKPPPGAPPALPELPPSAAPAARKPPALIVVRARDQFAWDFIAL
jgi:hypothetical protein